MKTCKTCGIEKEDDSFYLARKRVDGSFALRPHCITCSIKKTSDNYHLEGGKEKQKKRSFKHNLKRYNITPEDYFALLEKQGKTCAICNTEKSFRNNTQYNLFVDHCHETGVVRGLLCHGCNAGLGLFSDNVSYLNKAIDYLNENSPRH